MKSSVICVQDYTLKIDATDIQITSYDGSITHIPTPEMVFRYKAGEKLTFGSKKAAKLFVVTHSPFFIVS